MENIKEKFRKSLEEGYKKYLTNGARSNKKIIPIHKTLAEIILKKLGGEKKGFSVKSMGIGDEKEYDFEGKYFSKKIDITILYKEKPISGLGFKFITTNYKQNSNNYFETMLGETANIRRAELLYGQILIFKHKMPYYSSDAKTFTKIEHINEQNLKKYLKLHNDNISGLFHKPDILFLNFVETGDEAEFEKIVHSYENREPEKISKSDFHKSLIPKINVKFISPDDLVKANFSDDTLRFLKSVGDFNKFIEAFTNLTKGKTYNV